MIAHEELKRYLHYDPETGIWIRLATSHSKSRKMQLFSRADRTHGKNRTRRHVTFKKRRYLAHRLAWFYMTGEWPRGIDHRDHDDGNNKWDNLRLADQSQNLANARRRKDNTSGHRGVSWSKEKKKWVAVLWFRKKHFHLGYYADFNEATKAYKVAAETHFGEYAYHA